MRQLESMETVSKRRPIGRAVLVVIFVLLALSAWWQVVNDFTDRSNEPMILTGLQVIIGAIAMATAWGSWVGARWAPAVALLYGLIAGGMVVSLGPLLDLPAESRRGLWTGGAMVLAFALLCAWWLQRSLRREREREEVRVVGFD
jgi:peptidoglycan/LPS O-acetylase OafA/YrhL